MIPGVNAALLTAGRALNQSPAFSVKVEQYRPVFTAFRHDTWTAADTYPPFDVYVLPGGGGVARLLRKDDGHHIFYNYVTDFANPAGWASTVDLGVEADCACLFQGTASGQPVLYLFYTHANVLYTMWCTNMGTGSWVGPYVLSTAVPNYTFYAAQLVALSSTELVLFTSNRGQTGGQDYGYFRVARVTIDAGVGTISTGMPASWAAKDYAGNLPYCCGALNPSGLALFAMPTYSHNLPGNWTQPLVSCYGTLMMTYQGGVWSNLEATPPIDLYDTDATSASSDMIYGLSNINGYWVATMGVQRGSTLQDVSYYDAFLVSKDGRSWTAGFPICQTPVRGKLIMLQPGGGQPVLYYVGNATVLSAPATSLFGLSNTAAITDVSADTVNWNARYGSGGAGSLQAVLDNEAGQYSVATGNVQPLAKLQVSAGFLCSTGVGDAGTTQLVTLPTGYIDQLQRNLTVDDEHQLTISATDALGVADRWKSPAYTEWDSQMRFYDDFVTGKTGNWSFERGQIDAVSNQLYMHQATFTPDPLDAEDSPPVSGENMATCAAIEATRDVAGSFIFRSGGTATGSSAGLMLCATNDLRDTGDPNNPLDIPAPDYWLVRFKNNASNQGEMSILSRGNSGSHVWGTPLDTPLTGAAFQPYTSYYCRFQLHNGYLSVQVGTDGYTWNYFSPSPYIFAMNHTSVPIKKPGHVGFRSVVAERRKAKLELDYVHVQDNTNRTTSTTGTTLRVAGADGQYFLPTVGATHHYIYIGDELRELLAVRPGSVSTGPTSSSVFYDLTLSLALNEEYTATDYLFWYENAVAYDAVAFTSMNRDWTMGEILQDAFWRAGLPSNVVARVADPCTALNTDLWDTSKKSGTWGVSNGYLTVSTAGDGYLASKTARANMHLHARVKLDGGGAGLIFHASSDLAYRKEFYIYPSTDSGGGVRYLRYGAGLGIMSQILAPLPPNITVSEGVVYEMDVTIQNEWVSVWLNNCWLASFQDGNLLDSPLYQTWGLSGSTDFGAGDTASFADVTISELDEVVESIAIDANESPLSFMGRIIEQRTVKAIPRYDGSLLFGRFLTKALTESYEHSIIETQATLTSHDRASHIRLQGAEPYIDYIDTSILFSPFGYNFTQVEANHLYTVSQLLEEVQAVARRMKETSDQRNFKTLVRPWQEVEDRIHIKTIDGTDTDFIVDGLTITLDSDEQGVTFDADITTRLYVP